MLTDPFFELVASRRARRSRTTRSRSARCATSASRSPRSSPRRASSRATPPSSSRSSTSRSPPLVDARRGAGRRRADPPRGGRLERRLAGRLRLGRRRGRARRGRPRRAGSSELHFDRFSSTPLECSGCARRVQPRHGQWTLYCNHQMPGVGAIWMAPALRVGIDKLRFVSQDIGGALRQQDLPAPVATSPAACSRASSTGPVQWTEWRTDQHTGERARQRALVPRHRGRRSRPTARCSASRCKALDDCGAFPRYEPLGCIIWAQVTPGCYRWQNIRVDFTQVVHEQVAGVAEPRLLAHAAPLADRADHRHRRARARARPGRDAQAQLRAHRGDAVRRRRTAASTTPATTRAASTSRSS